MLAIDVKLVQVEYVIKNKEKQYMKYLIDGITKSVLALANQWRYLKKGDEYRVYDPVWTNIDGDDLAHQSAFYTDYELKATWEKEYEEDSRRFKITTNFEESLDWCDCYVSFRSFTYELNNSRNLTQSSEDADNLLDRLHKAMNLNKKVYLGNMFSQEFEEIVKTYPNCINKLITKEDLNNFKDYSYFYKSVAPIQFYTTMIVGTNSASGKFSCAMKVKKHYEDLGERVVLIHTEETYPFLDDQDGTIRGFCRNFSEMTTDEDFQYFQCFVVSILEEKHPDRIIFVTQSGFGVDGIVSSYQDTNNGRKMKGLWDIFIERSFGLNEVVVSTNYDTLNVAQKIINYYKIVNQAGQNTILKFVYINPIRFGSQTWKIEKKEDTSKYFTVAFRADCYQLLQSIKGFMIENPDLDINIDYGDLREKLTEFKNSEIFNQQVILLRLAKDIEELKKLNLSESFVNQVNDMLDNFEIKLKN